MGRKFYHDKYHVDTLRLREWDYSHEGKYFITINAKNKGNIFGGIVNGEMILNSIGLIAEEYILNIPEHFSFIVDHAHIVMPDHVHLLLEINKRLEKETPHSASIQTTKIPIASRHPLRQGYEGQVGVMRQDKMIQVETCYSTSQKGSHLKKNSISLVINQYKGAVTRYCKQNNLPFKWKARFYDKIIRSDIEFDNTKRYIITNPKTFQKQNLSRDTP
ncbi:MAG: transposase [Candidatus Neomarinimicrobiota bacterium]